MAVVDHIEEHRSHRVGWLRAGVLGANDGVVSTASIIIGMVAANSSHETIMLAGVAGLIAGSMSMAAGEYVSVSSQADTESADLAIEQVSLDQHFELEKDELAKIYEERGLDEQLAAQVADQLMAQDPLDAHARDELGIHDRSLARPLQAALTSAASFLLGGVVPVAVSWLVLGQNQIAAIAAVSLLFLVCLGAIAARIGGASMIKGALRVTLWGTLAMGVTAFVGYLFGVS